MILLIEFPVILVFLLIFLSYKYKLNVGKFFYKLFFVYVFFAIIFFFFNNFYVTNLSIFNFIYTYCFDIISSDLYILFYYYFVQSLAVVLYIGFFIGLISIIFSCIFFCFKYYKFYSLRSSNFLFLVKRQQFLKQVNYR